MKPTITALIAILCLTGTSSFADEGFISVPPKKQKSSASALTGASNTHLQLLGSYAVTISNDMDYIALSRHSGDAEVHFMSRPPASVRKELKKGAIATVTGTKQSPLLTIVITSDGKTHTYSEDMAKPGRAIWMGSTESASSVPARLSIPVVNKHAPSENPRISTVIAVKNPTMVKK